ncbi:MAG: (deoxy)nucleoside triphosphate pyrophosphohydrolase [Ignavibacteria bacterium]|nr:(deoxy)nucleoside triphosphate pyrophosphohydrolase [Ignavibacteria bacterium]MBI3765994.1 (deoxy)nucleoside triphosphate pyrophosphohydrolase [Ignavibacteriales bacterium]
MIQVAVGIIMKNGEVLLCQRHQQARYGLKWEFPGGKVETEEETNACLRRELHEELAIDAVVGDLYHQQHALYPDSGTFDVFYYIVPAFTGELVNHVFESCEWVPIQNLDRYDILEGNRDVVQKLMNEYAKIPSQND